MSFFDDDEPPAQETRQPRAPRPRRPTTAGAHAADHQTILVRRGVFFGGALIALILVVLLISSCESSARHDALVSYNDDVVHIGQDSQSVGDQFFGYLTTAQGKSAAQIGPELAALTVQAQRDVSNAQGLSVPGSLDVAQRALLLALDLRLEAVSDTASRIPVALGGLSGSGPALRSIAGDMERVLASDVLFQDRVTPLIAKELSANGISPAALPSSVWVHDLGWLQEGTVASRLTGAAGTGTNGTALAPGTHGHALVGVSVGGNTLNPTPAVNNIAGGANPTFMVNLTNTGQNNETGVTVQVSVTGQGQTRTASKVLPLTKPGQSYTVPVQVQGVPLQVPASITAYVVPVPGEKNVANNKATFTALFTQ